MGQISVRPPNRNLTQLKNLILAGEFSVKVEIEEGDRRALLTLKRPLGDINAEEGGEIHYWSLLGRSWGIFGGSWGDLERPRGLEPAGGRRCSRAGGGARAKRGPS